MKEQPWIRRLAGFESHLASIRHRKVSSAEGAALRCGFPCGRIAGSCSSLLFRNSRKSYRGKRKIGLRHIGSNVLSRWRTAGGTPLCLKTQDVEPGKGGVMLGSTTNQGSPTHLPASGEARRPGKQAEGQAEQPCILLPSVPYALKAGDRADLGGTAGLGLRCSRQ
jgi:hypothetical protein